MCIYNCVNFKSEIKNKKDGSNFTVKKIWVLFLKKLKGPIFLLFNPCGDYTCRAQTLCGYPKPNIT